MKCTNCKVGDADHTWQGVPLCSDCHKMVSHTVSNTEREVRMVYLLYLDMIRVSLIKGEFRPQVLPRGNDMPTSEMENAVKNMAKRLSDKLSEGSK